MKPIYLMLASLILYSACNPREKEAVSDFPLKAYVEAGDEAFSYTVVDTLRGSGWTEYRIRMVSGTWLTTGEVDHPEWWHWINVVVPDRLQETEAMMIIGGGSAHDTLTRPMDVWLTRASVATGSVIAQVSNIPFQPLDFVNDEKGERYEDDLIAYGWRQYLESGAADDHLEWLARFPMTRAVVRAMDVVQEITQNAPVPVQQFFVAGASKRGWTTWTTAAVDDRVMGMAPVVIDLLNIVPSFLHHWRCYGEWSPAVQEYVDEGIMDWMDSDEFARLLEVVGPYSFVDSLTIPKLLINAADDEFFVTDSWKFYWDDLKGERYLQYIPNSGHGLNGSYQPISLVAFYRSVITSAPLPRFNWTINGNSIEVEVEPESDYLVRYWEAVNPEARDFRIYVVGEAWEMRELEKNEVGTYTITVSEPETGYKAALVELVFDPDSELPLTFTTGTLITPDTYPFPPFVPDTSRIHRSHPAQ